jgi:peptidyl-prolyl cis-trans isomerase C
VATVGPDRILKSDIQHAISKMHLPNGVPDSVPSDVLNRLIERALIAQEAEREGLAQEPSIKKRIEADRERILRHTLIKRKVDSMVKVSDADIRNYYDKHKAEIKQPGFVIVRQLILPDMTIASKIKKVFRQKHGFRKEIGQYKGGSVGKIFEGTVPPQFVKLFFGLPAGTVSGPLSLKDGVHYFKIDQVEPGKFLSFDEAKSGIGQYLSSRQKQDRYQAFLNSIRAKTKININQKSLGEVYSALNPSKPAVSEGPASAPAGSTAGK